MYTESQINDMKRPQLQKLCKDAGLSAGGKVCGYAE
jgi:hypothetical protein